MVSGRARVEELASLVQWTGAPDLTVDVRAAEESLGIRLPSDYYEYVRRFPPGTFQDFLVVLNVRPSPYVADLARAVSRIVENLQEDLAGAVDFPYRLFPEPGGLLPWGYIGMDDLFFWHTEGDDPDDWGTVVTDHWLSEPHRYAGSFTECVTSLIHGTSGLPEMEHLAARAPSFVPLKGD